MGTKRIRSTAPAPRLNDDGSCNPGCTCLLCQCAMPTSAVAGSNYRNTPAFEGHKRSSSEPNRVTRRVT